jgi:tetratricopeptide (TPR) repeat protein
MAKSNKKTKAKKSKSVAPKVAPKFPDWLLNARWHMLGLFALSVLLYVNTFSHEYAQDDAIVIYDNMFTSDGVKGIPGILQNDTFYGFFKEEGKANLVAGGRYRPFTLILFALEVQLFGLSPMIGHLMNALYYALTVVVLYLVVFQFFSTESSNAKAYFTALVTALLFAAHPIHTEVVANIKGRDEIFTLLGSLLALYCSFKAMKTKQIVWHFLAGVFFFMALMSKENAITFLAIVPLTYFFFTKTEVLDWIKSTIPFIVAAGVFLFIRTQILGFSLGDTSMELMNNPFLKIENGTYVNFTFGEKLATILFAMGKYLQLLFFPITLTHDYYPRQIDLMQWTDWSVLLSLITYLGLSAYALVGLLKKNPLSYAILFFLITFSIVSNVLFPVGTHMSERFMFMPSVGFCMAIALLLWNQFLAKKKTGNLNIAMGLVLLVVLAYSIRTITRNTVWKNNYTLFTNDIENSPNSAKLRNAVGGELITQSVQREDFSEAQKTAMQREAVGHLLEAIKLHPNYKNSYLLLGNAHNYLKEYEKAIQYYQQALSLDPSYSEADNNLGITYRDAGRYYGEQKGDLGRAIQYLEQAYAYRPDEYETVRLLGVAYGIQGNSAKAIEYFKKGIELNPEDADAFFNLGTAWLNAGDTEKANFYHQKALELDPEVLNRRQKK